MITTQDIPYGYYDLSNNLITNIPISVEVIPYKAIPIIDIQINRNNQIYSRENYMHIIFKCIAYTILSIPILLVLIGFFLN